MALETGPPAGKPKSPSAPPTIGAFLRSSFNRRLEERDIEIRHFLAANGYGGKAFLAPPVYLMWHVYFVRLLCTVSV